MEQVLKWFTGGEHYTYHNLFHCLDGDYFTITLVILLCVGVFTGYLVIAWRWSMAARETPGSNVKAALNELKWIFIFCGLCGYIWVAMEAVWPAWRLYLFFLFALNIYTWRYVFRIEGIEELYAYLREKENLTTELRQQREEIERLKAQARELAA